jgi:hypothetical protein
MKEQYNQFQKIIEEIPKLKQESHFIINDAANHILNNEPLSKIEEDALDAILLELQDLDKDIVLFLLNIKGRGIVSKNECNLVISLFLISKQIGPDINIIRESFYESIISLEDFEELLKNASIPMYSKSVILSVYEKIIKENRKINK